MERHRFLFVSLDGLIGDVAWQVAKEGHDVRYYIDTVEEREIGDGFVPKVDSWEERRAIENAAWSVAGVEAVDDRLTIVR